MISWPNPIPGRFTHTHTKRANRRLKRDPNAGNSHIAMRKESVPKITINNTINLFYWTAISILVISNHSSLRVLFDRFASVYFIWKIYLYFLALEIAGRGNPSTVPVVSAHYTFVPYIVIATSLCCVRAAIRRQTAISGTCDHRSQG